MEDFNKYTSHINYSPIVDFTLQQGKETSYKKGEYFVRQGEACKIMGFVVSGSFRYCCVNSLGESSIVGYTFDHSFVGNYPAFQLQDQSNVDIQALCDCTVYVSTIPNWQISTTLTTTTKNWDAGLRKLFCGKYMIG